MIGNQKGMTLIELVMVLLLMGIVGSSITIGQRMLREATLKSKANEVAMGLEYIKQSAVATGESYNICCFDHKIYVRKGIKKPMYVIQLGDGIRVPKDITGKLICFRGTMAPRDGAATIKLVDDSLKKQVRITVGVGTGKIRIYYETL